MKETLRKLTEARIAQLKHEAQLAEDIRAERVELGLSLRATAKKLEISPAFLSDIENGNRKASVNVLEKMRPLFNL